MVIADSKNIPTSLYLQEKGHDYTIFAQIMIEMQISPPLLPPASYFLRFFPQLILVSELHIVIWEVSETLAGLLQRS